MGRLGGLPDREFLSLMLRFLKWTLLLILVGAGLCLLVAYWASTNDCSARKTPPDNPMKAIVYCDYGSPDVLNLEEIEKPLPEDNQVLVRVRAASLNPLDWHYLEGTPRVVRFLGMGLRKPKSTRLGVDFAGTVEAVGSKVTQFKAGDEVFGGKTGAFAEYVVVRDDRAVVLKPAAINFEQAAALPIAGLTALQALRDKGELKQGQDVLINGASGGVGTFAVQIAKSMGAHVTGVCSERSAELVRSLGADQIVDYTKEDFTARPEKYDLILDNVGTQPLLAFRKALKPNGICVLIGGGGTKDGKWVGAMVNWIKPPFINPFIQQKFRVLLADFNQKDLTTLAGLEQSGKMKSIIDRRYKLADAASALRYLEEGHAHGKVVITVD